MSVEYFEVFVYYDGIVLAFGFYGFFLVQRILPQTCGVASYRKLGLCAGSWWILILVVCVSI
jgi:hypothetical protein